MSELFIGSAICTVSSQGELDVPNAFCLAIQSRAARERLYMALHESAPCLIIFDRAAAADQQRRLAERSRSPDDLDHHDDLLRRAFGLAAATRMDGRGRLLIAPWMHRSPGRSFRTLLVGKGDHFEVWNLTEVLKNGPDVLAMLARLHLHIGRDGEDDDEPARPHVEACVGADGVLESWHCFQPLPALAPRHDPVAHTG